MLFAVILLLLLGVSSGQRPQNATICDYYAVVNYGSNSTATQLKLMQSILALAFGGAGPLSNVNSSITGIFNPGNFIGTPVDLQPWFNGVKDSTNLNNQAVGIDWLDGGGTDPLHAFLAGTTPNLTFTDAGSNEACVPPFIIEDTISDSWTGDSSPIGSRLSNTSTAAPSQHHSPRPQAASST
jgi:hypothetical protein